MINFLDRKCRGKQNTSCTCDIFFPWKSCRGEIW